MATKIDTQHQYVRSQMLQRIQESTSNTRLTAERRLAEEFGVCRATMNRVLVELEREGYLVRRPGCGTFVAPRDKEILQNRSVDAAGSVIMAYPDFFSYTLWEQVHASEMLALKNNLHMINLKLQPKTDFSALFELAEATPDLVGILLQPPMDGMPKGTLERLDRLKVPSVVLFALDEVTLYEHIFEVHFDHFKSGYLRMAALLRAGHRRIGFVPNEAYTSINSPTVRGMRQALREYGMRWKDIALPASQAENWESNLRKGYLQTMELLNDSTLTALLIDTMPGCFGVLRALHERKLRCPEDISLVTSMGFMELENLTCPALTTVESDLHAMIGKAFSVLLGQERAKRILIDHRLIERESIRVINS